MRFVDTGFWFGLQGFTIGEMGGTAPGCSSIVSEHPRIRCQRVEEPTNP